MQDTFIYLWENRNDFTDPLSIKVFLYRTVKNKCLNQLKHLAVKDKAIQNQITAMDENLFEKNYIHEETVRLIYQAIETLPNNCKVIIELAIKGLKNPEIAEEMGISVNTVKTHKKEAYRLLRMKLKDVLPSVMVLLEIIK